MFHENGTFYAKYKDKEKNTENICIKNELTIVRASTMSYLWKGLYIQQLFKIFEIRSFFIS